MVGPRARAGALTCGPSQLAWHSWELLSQQWRSARYSSGTHHQPGRPTKEIAHRPRHAATELALAKENGSLRAEDPPPETTTVVISSSRAHPAEQPAAPLVAGSAQLVRQLQQELKRLGCYSHEINGEWTPATRVAMKDFLESEPTPFCLWAHPMLCTLHFSKVSSNPCAGPAVLLVKPWRREPTVFRAR